MAFKRATKEAALARIALYGPSGSGKTYSALLMAQGLGKKIAVIDSEIAADGKDLTGAACKYSDRFEFEVEELRDKSVVSYIAAITAAKLAGYDVLIIDSISHAWKSLQTEVEKISKAKFGGNYWAAWSEGNPIQERFLNAIVGYPGHVIATMRARTTWGQSQDKNGRDKPERMGLEPEQGKGIEYEFDLLISINADHFAVVEKDRSGRFQDRVIQKPDQSFGAEIAGWLQNTDAIPGLDPVNGNGFEVCTADQIKDIRTLLTIPAIKDETRKAIEEKLAGPPFSKGKAAAIIEKLNAARAAFKDAKPAADAQPKADPKPKLEKKPAKTKAETKPATAPEQKPATPPAADAKPAAETKPAPEAAGVPFEPATGLKDVEKLDDSAVVVLFNELCDRYRVSVVALDTYTGVAFGPGKTHRELPIERKRAILADPEPFLKVVARKNGKPVDEPPVNWSAKAPEAFRMNPDPTADGVVDGIPY